ncbi:serine/threonine-protein phosphatase 6 regulatory subunit 2 [Cinnamomum micranthum f. kanehirae]|uniref:Serine/threonine-protein phosphatase 6 regulatory subunit 2 n=1 Tax=Cinnamomum micranthum f. kanehirae TaxID=337451 RepID=A0A443P4X5_9MAGN|nr:serine/threonine-protein phosphatase 6 regulatory subunit 2 [Cinnamomum micranthum f. kanehirae]
MFWRMAGLSTASPVDSILDKKNYTLEELLDEDEIIQECKALNGRLINFLRERAQVEQLLQYIVEESSDAGEKRRTFKFPFVACEIFTCEVDIILKTLVEDEELLHLLFSFLRPNRSHSTLLAGYFSKVVICLMLRKTVPFMNYVRGHHEIFLQLIDLIGITSIMEVLIRLIGADEYLYSNYMDSTKWLEHLDVLEMILDKFSSSDSPEVHTNAAESLCVITRFAPPALAAKISSPSFVGRLFRYALEDSRPKSVLVHSISVCISLLDPKRSTIPPYQAFCSNQNYGSSVTASPEAVQGMLESLGDLLKLLDVSSSETVLPTAYGKLQPPLGKHRLKIVEFILVLVTIDSESAERELIQQGAIKRILDLFFEYPYNNFLHRHVENIIVSCLDSKKAPLIDHLLQHCDLAGKILEAERNFTLSTNSKKPTVPAEGRIPPKIGNIGHLTRISNKLIQVGNSNDQIKAYLQENNEWLDWHMNVLLKRNTLQNVYQWACGRPTALHDRTRDSDEEDIRDRDYDVAALANNLSLAFQYGVSNNENIQEAHGSLERDDEDVYFDDESAEVVISSLRLGNDQDSGSLFTNSNWFAFEDDRVINERSPGPLATPSPTTEEGGLVGSSSDDEVIVGEDSELVVDTAASSKVPEQLQSVKLETGVSSNGLAEEDARMINPIESDKPPEWVELRETSESDSSSSSQVDLSPALPNGVLEEVKDQTHGEASADLAEPASLSNAVVVDGAEEIPSSRQAQSCDGNLKPDLYPHEGLQIVECKEGRAEAEEHMKAVENEAAK